MPLLASSQATARFSLDQAMLATILDKARPLGHHEDESTLNLGFGFLYYGLVRTLRPRHVVVIGSGFGFSVVCLALAMKDNGVGRLSFVDPSYSLLRNGPLQTIGGTAQWDEPRKVRDHFARFGVEHIVTHYRQTSEDFFKDWPTHGLPPLDIGFIDGNHSFEAAHHDFSAAVQVSHANTYLLLHDTNLYLRELIRHAGVKRLVKAIARRPEDFEVIDFPFSSGVALVRVRGEGQRISVVA